MTPQINIYSPRQAKFISASQETLSRHATVRHPEFISGSHDTTVRHAEFISASHKTLSRHAEFISASQDTTKDTETSSV